VRTINDVQTTSVSKAPQGTPYTESVKFRFSYFAFCS